VVELASKVFTMDRRSHSPETGFVAQMLTLFDEPGFEELVKPGDVVAIKVHCGEWNNTAYLRPVYARAVADRVKELGGRPFVCDTTTLTYGPRAARSIAPDLLVTAERNGYNSSTLGCPFIVADGYNGTDDMMIPMPEGYILREAYVANAIALADSMIVLTHFKGHPMGVIGGSIKNLGIGAQSKRGKYNVHMGGHPTYGLPATVEYHPENVTPEILDMIPDLCPHEAYSQTNGTLEWDKTKCNTCLGCLGVMASAGVWSWPEENYRAFNAAVADGCLATLKALDGKVGFLNMALDVSPKCDCVDHADVPITPHLGIFSGWDPVALDKACLDRATEVIGMPGSAADDWDVAGAGDHKFSMASALVPGLSEEIQLHTGVEIGLGHLEYDLIEIEQTRQGAEFAFTADRRLIGAKYGRIYKKENPFPADKFDGKGFDRLDKVDLDKVAGPSLTPSVSG